MNDIIAPEQAFESVSAWKECGGSSVEGSLWVAWLHVAQRFGWIPAGTLPRDGNYYPPDGQRVSQEDVKQLDRALKRADIQNCPAWVDLPDGHPYDGWYRQSSSLMQRQGPIKSILQGFIAHCQECAELWLY